MEYGYNLRFLKSYGLGSKLYKVAKTKTWLTVSNSCSIKTLVSPLPWDLGRGSCCLCCCCYAYVILKCSLMPLHICSCFILKKYANPNQSSKVSEFRDPPLFPCNKNFPAFSKAKNERDNL